MTTTAAPRQYGCGASMGWTLACMRVPLLADVTATALLEVLGLVRWTLIGGAARGVMPGHGVVPDGRDARPRGAARAAELVRAAGLVTDGARAVTYQSAIGVPATKKGSGAALWVCRRCQGLAPMWVAFRQRRL